MDSVEATKIVHDRIFQLEPENVARKIIGYIYLQNLPDHEMIRLALGADSFIQNLIQKVKTALFLASKPVTSPPISPTMTPILLSNPPFQRLAHSWDSPIVNEQQTNSQFMSVDDSMEKIKLGDDYYCDKAAFNHLGIRGNRNSSNLMDFSVHKTCHYFKQGFCKNGSNCRYFHGELNYPPMLGSNSYETAGENQLLSPRSLEKLEMEITEILKSRKGYPISIAALPMMYYEKYGRTLQAEGYLTESQRHGKAGFNLTKLLARLKNSIRLINRLHGQHSVILVEDAAKYMEIRGERNDPGPIVSESRQIYLTFPGESTFTEEDVSNYFSNFGQVQNVRIPCQQKRMFGFVTFFSADTVKLILSKENPHYVCGARVLVKPYREKSKLVERKYQEKFDHHTFYHSRNPDFDPELHARWLRSRLVEEHEHAIEFEVVRLSQLQLARKSFGNQSSLSYSMDELKLAEDNTKFSSAERFTYLHDIFGSTGSDNPKHLVNSCGDQ